MSFTLRDYQQIQVDFLEEHVPISNVCSIQSGTGSGKSIVMMEYARRYLQENPLQNIVISTGFNRLVFDLEKTAKAFELDPLVLIGSLAVNCPQKMTENYQIFTEEDHTCGNEHKHLDDTTDIWSQKRCPYCRSMYRQRVQEIANARGKVIITNHSSLLVHQDTLANVGVIIIDEAHTFANFYDSYLQLNISKEELMKIDEAINNVGQPMSSIIKMNIKRGVCLPTKQVDALMKACNDRQLAAKAEEFFTVQRDIGHFVEVDESGYTLSKFYKHFELKIPAKIILFSATLDEYTLKMFRVPKIHRYIESKMFCDYERSEFIAIPRNEFMESLKDFLDYVYENNLKIGCILSTTIYDMNKALSIDGYNDYKMYTDKVEFASAPAPKILVGSRALFQGIDLPELQFVCLNKLPFPNHDDKDKALQNYLTDGGTNNYDTWGDYTVPKTENDISQSLGRLWRTPTSKGIVSIFDPRIERFSYLIKHTMYMQRFGIKIKLMNNDHEVKDWSIV